MATIYTIKHYLTGETYKAVGLKEFDSLCERLNIKSNTLFRAKAEGRNTLCGFNLIDASEAPKDVLTAVIVSDIHFCRESKESISILYQVLSDIKEEVDEFIDLGDGVNNDALSSYVCVEDKKYTLYEEIVEYKNHMDKVRKFLGEEVKYVVTQDNHFHLRKKRFLAENPAMVGLIPDISDRFDEEVPHGKLYFPFNQDRVGCIHGISINDCFTKKHIEMYGRYDVICGHTHTMQLYVAPSGTADTPPRRSYGIPSMCSVMEYLNGKPSRQVNGFAVMTYNKEVGLYNIEYVVVENSTAMFRGKLYKGGNI